MSRTIRPRCLALTRSGDQCRGHAAHGSDYCGAHRPNRRRNKLDELTAEVLVGGARKGLHRTPLAELAGIDPRTLYRWLEAGAADEEAGKHETAYARLRQRLARAEAEAEESILAAVRTAAIGVTVVDEDGDEVNVPSDWRAGAWFLERRYPDRYGQRNRVEHSGEVKRTGELVEVSPPEEAELAVARILARAGAVNLDAVNPEDNREDPHE